MWPVLAMFFFIWDLGHITFFYMSMLKTFSESKDLEATKHFDKCQEAPRKNSPFLSLHLLRSMIHMKHDQPRRGVQHRVGFFVDFRGQLRSGAADSFWYVLMVRMLR